MRGPIRLNPGAVFAQDFEVKSQIAEGGMGTVYAVVDRTCGEERALKVLLPELVTDEKTRQRFSQESQIAAQIESRYVPRIFRTGIDDAGVPYIAMELLRGRDLRRHIKDRGPLTLEQARPILIQLGDALAAAHRRGLVHRDLKPENVFLADLPDGTMEVKLLDFGVAKVIDVARTSAAGTGAIGSPLWMAPEQTAAGGRIAPSTDVFAYGLVAFYLLTGAFYWKSAHDGSGVGGLLRELHVDDFAPASVRAAQIGKPPVFSAAFDAWFMRALVRDGAQRYRDGGEALEALMPVFDAPPITHSAAAFAETMEVPAGASITSPLGGASPGAHALRGMAGEERHDTEQSAFESNIPPTDPPPPMPHAEPPMPPVAATVPIPLPERPTSMLPWILGLLFAGLFTMICSGALVWLALLYTSAREESSSSPPVTAPVPLAADQRWSGTFTCGALYPSTLTITSVQGERIEAALDTQRHDGSTSQRFAGTYSPRDRRLLLDAQDDRMPIHHIAGQVSPDGGSFRGRVYGPNPCVGTMSLTREPS